LGSNHPKLLAGGIDAPIYEFSVFITCNNSNLGHYCFIEGAGFPIAIMAHIIQDHMKTALGGAVT
jgi:hypothetical protein